MIGCGSLTPDKFRLTQILEALPRDLPRTGLMLELRTME